MITANFYLFNSSLKLHDKKLFFSMKFSCIFKDIYPICEDDLRRKKGYPEISFYIEIIYIIFKAILPYGGLKSYKHIHLFDICHNNKTLYNFLGLNFLLKVFLFFGWEKFCGIFSFWFKRKVVLCLNAICCYVNKLCVYEKLTLKGFSVFFGFLQDKGMFCCLIKERKHEMVSLSGLFFL